MRLLLLTLLAAALCVEMAQSLQCYTCNKANSNEKCMGVINCTTAAGSSCQTDVWGYGMGKIITKQCVTSCIENNLMVSEVGHYTKCCGTDRCNVSGATSVELSHAVLVVAAGFIGLLLRGGL